MRKKKGDTSLLVNVFRCSLLGIFTTAFSRLLQFRYRVRSASQTIRRFLHWRFHQPLLTVWVLGFHDSSDTSVSRFYRSTPWGHSRPFLVDIFNFRFRDFVSDHPLLSPMALPSRYSCGCLAFTSMYTLVSVSAAFAAVQLHGELHFYFHEKPSHINFFPQNCY